MKNNIIQLIALALCLITIGALCGCSSEKAAVKPEEVYQNFMNGSIPATDLNGKEITVQSLKDQANQAFGGEYAMYDVTGDGVTELCVRTAEHLTLFTQAENSLKCLREFPADCVVLNNGAIWQLQSDVLTGKTQYRYIVLDANGQDKEVVTFSADPASAQYVYNDKTVTKEEYTTLTQPYTSLKNDQLTWTALGK